MASRHAWNICYRQPDTINDRKTHVPIEIEAHRNVEVIMNCKKGLFDAFCHRKHIFTKGIGFTSCKKSYFFLEWCMDKEGNTLMTFARRLLD